MFFLTHIKGYLLLAEKERHGVTCLQNLREETCMIELWPVFKRLFWDVSAIFYPLAGLFHVFLRVCLGTVTEDELGLMIGEVLVH